MIYNFTLWVWVKMWTDLEAIIFHSRQFSLQIFKFSVSKAYNLNFQ
jgi:hypothetical protein